MIDLLRGYFSIQDRDDHRTIREKVTGKLLALDESLKSSVAAVLALLDTPFAEAEWEKLEPEQRRQRTLHALKKLLLRESQVQPLLIVFQDLHWIDSETQALLNGLVESLPLARVLLLVNYRPGYEHEWDLGRITRICGSIRCGRKAPGIYSRRFWEMRSRFSR